MTEQVKVRINNETLSLLKCCIGKKLIKIGYVIDQYFSATTILVFEGSVIKLINRAIVADCFGEEYPHFSAEETVIIDDVAYENEKYEYLEICFSISSIETLIDKVTWDSEIEHGYFDIQNGIILHNEKGEQIIFYAFNSIAEAIGIYFDRAEFNEKNAIEDKWPIEEAENIKYERIIESI